MKLIDYDQLVRTALRQMVREILERTQEKGLPGQHHFYITFETPNCVLPDWLRKRYPQEMTIVIQRQYEDLVVEKDSFSITLYFDNRPERLTILFKAMTGFADPHTSFSLRLAADVKAGDIPPSDPKGSPSTKITGQVVELDAFRKQK